MQSLVITYSVPRRWTFEPLTRTVTELFVNQAYCRLVALPADELLARVVRRELPPRMGHLDHLCHVLAGLHAQLGAEDDVEYIYWQVCVSEKYPAATELAVRASVPATRFEPVSRAVKESNTGTNSHATLFITTRWQALAAISKAYSCEHAEQSFPSQLRLRRVSWYLAGV